MTDYGSEYFNGDINSMIQDMTDIKNNFEKLKVIDTENETDTHDNSSVSEFNYDDITEESNDETLCKFCDNSIKQRGGGGRPALTCGNIECLRKNKTEQKRRQRKRLQNIPLQ